MVVAGPASPRRFMPASPTQCCRMTPWSGSPGVDAIVTALVLAASRRSVSAPSDDRTDPSATRSMRACGLVQGGAARVRSHLLWRPRGHPGAARLGVLHGAAGASQGQPAGVARGRTESPFDRRESLGSSVGRGVALTPPGRATRAITGFEALARSFAGCAARLAVGLDGLTREGCVDGRCGYLTMMVPCMKG